MRDFMDYVHSAFYEATGWTRDNSYAALNSTPDAILEFPTPLGLRLTLASLASPNFATSYQLGSVGIVDGSISYLFSSVPLRVLLEPRSDNVQLPQLMRAYRPLEPLANREGPQTQASQDKPNSSLLYGRIYLPQSLLEALVVRRLTPALQVQFSAVSGSHLRNGGTAVGMAQYDVGRYAVEALASSDGGLLGLRGVYNFGGDSVGDGSKASTPAVTDDNINGSSGNGNGSGHSDRERIHGRFSTGAEVYYGTQNKPGGVSVGTRFATLPTHNGTPLSATLTLNPLMGNISANYAVVAGRHCSLASRMEFNILSYESAWAVGMELWRKPLAWAADSDDARLDNFGLPKRSFDSKLAWKLDEPAVSPVASQEKTRSEEGEEHYAGVLKTRLDHNLQIGVLWEGRVKSLLFSLGSGIDLRRLDKPFRTLGLEIQFSS